VAHQAGAYPSFRGMKQLRVFLLPLDAMLDSISENLQIADVKTEEFLGGRCSHALYKGLGAHFSIPG